MRTPVGVGCFEVRNTGVIPGVSEAFQLGYCLAQGVFDPLKPGPARLLRCFCDHLKKVSPVRIVWHARTLKCLWVPEQLGHKMKVADGFEESCYLTEFSVRIYLLKVGLGSAQIVLFVILVRPGYKETTILPPLLETKDRLAVPTNLLRDANSVAPLGPSALFRQFNLNFNVWLLPSS